MKKVYIGIGHGGTDSGAVANGFKEKDLNLSIALACGEFLAKYDVRVMLSRQDDITESVNSKVSECNKYDPDLCLDIHNNAGGGDGVEVYHHHGGGTSKKLAQNILNEVVEIGQNSRGIKTKLNASGSDYYAFIRNTGAPAVIVECAFVDNKKDLAIIDTVAEQKAMGEAIAKGILKTLGITYKENDMDNKPDSYAVEAVKWAIEKGILKGTDTGDYLLHKPVTRQDMLVFLYRALKK